MLEFKSPKTGGECMLKYGLGLLVCYLPSALAFQTHKDLSQNPVEMISLDGETNVKQRDSDQIKALKKAYNRSLDSLVGGSLRNVVEPTRSHHVTVCKALQKLGHITDARPSVVTPSYIESVAGEVAKLGMSPTENFFTFVLLSRGESYATQNYFDDGFCELLDTPRKSWFEVGAISSGMGHGENNHRICRKSFVTDRHECQIAVNAYCHSNTCN